jgi:hypothetical protein
LFDVLSELKKERTALSSGAVNMLASKLMKLGCYDVLHHVMDDVESVPSDIFTATLRFLTLSQSRNK